MTEVGPGPDIHSLEQLVALQVPLPPFQQPDRCGTIQRFVGFGFPDDWRLILLAILWQFLW